MKLIPLSIKCIVLLWALLIISCAFYKKNNYQDAAFFSQALETERWYRIYLPKDYQSGKERYPVVYYFHGFGGRFKWDAYDLSDDANYPGNGRKNPPYVMEWSDFVKKNKVIIVTWDGYEPLNQPGRKFREGIAYSNCRPYDLMRAHESTDHRRGWDYRLYFRDLVKHIDDQYRTIANRDHRAVTGLSMGGLTSLYIAGQCKDLISSISTFDPADNIAYYGPKGEAAVFPNLEMHRSLKGIPTRLTMTDGDWLKYNDWKMKRIFKTVFGDDFDFHLADYPNHWAADIGQQLDFHMDEFGKPHPRPSHWNHISPGFKSFDVWNYHFEIERDEPGLAILEDVTPGHMKILSRSFLPDGPIIYDKEISVTTDSLYQPDSIYQISTFNLTTSQFRDTSMLCSQKGKLHFKLVGDGHIVGISRLNEQQPNLHLVSKLNQDTYYFEEGKTNHLDLKLLNLGGEEARDMEIMASSSCKELHFQQKTITVETLPANSLVKLEQAFSFQLEACPDTTYVVGIDLDIRIKDTVINKKRILFYPVPSSPYLAQEDLIVLDGRTQANVPIYQQGPNQIELQNISGGVGDGDGLLEPGEDALIYIKLPKGMAANDINTYHRSFLINQYDLQDISIKTLDYQEKLHQAAITSTASVLSLSASSPLSYEFDLWFRIESNYNDSNDATSNATIYAHKYDYRRVKLTNGN